MGSLWVLAARTLVVVGLCVAVCAASPTQAASVPEPIQLVEGSVVTLPQVLVTLTGQKWFFVKPLYASGPTISVWADADPPPTSGWTVNVTGRVLSASGKLFVYATRLELLIDPRTQMPCPPPVAGSVWADVRDIPLNLDAPTEGLAPPDPSSMIPVREPVDAAPGSIALALGRADADTMTVMDVGHGSPDSSQVTLTGKVVTATRGEFPNHIYCEEPNRSAGIRVKWSGAYEPARGDRVDVSGVIGTASDGERVIDADTGTPHGVTFVQTGTPLTPLGMINRAIGGSAFGPYSPGVDGGVGLFSKGLLVRTAGRVSSIDEPNKLFYITDGSLPDALKVSWDWPAGRPSIVPPQVGWKIGVTGLASSEVSGASMLRVLRPRDQSDLGVYEPADTADPDIEIISPKGTTWHKASGATFIVISGTADDDDTCVVKVEVKIGAGQYQPAVYDPVAKTWQYTWQNPSSTTVWARATDFAGNDAETSVGVTIQSVTVRYVNCARPDDTGNGQSWETAKKTIQEGINAAPIGGEVWVAAGTYFERVSTSWCAMYGGFSGTETVREQRNWRANETVIDGDRGGTVVNLGLTGVIDGFTIQNGYCYQGLGHGGGISCYKLTGSISNNVIRGNYAVAGGGLATVYGSPVIACNVFMDNTAAQSGSAMYIESPSPRAKVYNNTIIHNYVSTAGAGGGALATGFNCQLSNNIVAWNEGGGIYGGGSLPIFQNNDVFGNNPSNYASAWVVPPDTHPAGDLEPVDPGIPYADLGDWHIWWGSPCRDAGLNSVVLPVDCDLDAEPRRNGTVDIGADETDQGHRYLFTLARQALRVPVGTSVAFTASVVDSVPANHAESGCRVDICVDAGVILSVSPGGQFLNDQHTAAYGVTGDDGQVTVLVTRGDQGYVCITAVPAQLEQVSGRSMCAWFYDPAITPDWPMFHNDVALCGATPAGIGWSLHDAAPGNRLPKKWVAQLNGSSSTTQERTWSSPVVADGIVYVCTNSATSGQPNLYAFDLDGTQLAATYVGGPVHGTPCVSDGLVYVGAEGGGEGGAGRLHVYALQNGQFVEQWYYDCQKRTNGQLVQDTDQRIWGSVSVYEGAVYFGSTRSPSPIADFGWLHAVDLVTHTDRGGSPARMPYSAIGTTPGIAGDYAEGARAYLSDYSCYVSAVRCATGGAAWSYAWSGSDYCLYASPVAYLGHLFVGSDDGVLYRLADTGSSATSSAFAVGAAVESTPAAYNGKMYFGCSSGAVYCVDATTLEQCSMVSLDSAVIASPAISSTGSLVLVASNSTLYALDLTDISVQRWSHSFSADLPGASVRSSPAVVDGHLFIVAGDSAHRYLCCFGD